MKNIPHNFHSSKGLTDLSLNQLSSNEAFTTSLRKFNEISSCRHLKLNSIFRDYFSGTSNEVPDQIIYGTSNQFLNK